MTQRLLDRLSEIALSVCSERQLYTELRRRRRRQQRLDSIRRHPSSGVLQGPWTRDVQR